MTQIVVWHLAGNALRDNRALPKAGDELPYVPDPKPCVRGWHGSERLIDALPYALGVGVNLCRRLLIDPIPHGVPIDKYCAAQGRQLTLYVNVQRELFAWAHRVVVHMLRTCVADALHAARLPTLAAALSTLTEDHVLSTEDVANMRCVSGIVWNAWVSIRNDANSHALDITCTLGYLVNKLSRSRARDDSNTLLVAISSVISGVKHRAADNLALYVDWLEEMMPDQLQIKGKRL